MLDGDNGGGVLDEFYKSSHIELNVIGIQPRAVAGAKGVVRRVDWQRRKQLYRSNDETLRQCD